MVEKYREYQKQVVEEKADLDSKIDRIEAFVNRKLFSSNVGTKEQDLLRRQLMVMKYYSVILAERIENFS